VDFVLPARRATGDELTDVVEEVHEDGMMPEVTTLTR
jgi:hypothetical protein